MVSVISQLSRIILFMPQTLADSYDYIIVGAGSAGCVLANRLSTNPDKRVLLLEAGGEPYNPWLHIPVGYFKTMHNPQTDWCYVTEPDPGIGGRQLKWPRGKTLGGSSAINGLLYIRGQAEDYDDWEALGNHGWSYAQVLPYFKRAEDQERGGDEFHGSGGPLAVSDIRARRPICEAFIAAAAAIGIPPNDDFNGPQQEGVGYFQVTARGRFRCSTARGYLNPVRRRSNLTVLTRAHVRRLRCEQQQTTGIEFDINGQPRSAALAAGGELILSAGAIGSPHLLMLSGIGAPDMLQPHGIEMVHALPGVGQNLQDHLQLRAVYEMSVPTLNDEVASPLRQLGIGMQYIFCGSGPMAMAASQVAIFTRTPLSQTRPDIQFHFQPLSANSPGRLLDSYSGVSLSVCQLRPQSRGFLQLQSADAKTAPTIHPNYLSTPLDQETALAGLQVARKIAATAPFADYVVCERRPGSDRQGDEALLEGARRIAETIYHPVGTCKMGTAEDPMAVVDEQLRVYGIKNLRVVDASIMPLIPSGNTNAPTIMVAEKAADMIKAQ